MGRSGQEEKGQKWSAERLAERYVRYDIRRGIEKLAGVCNVKGR